jgi:hypothetical protein
MKVTDLFIADSSCSTDGRMYDRRARATGVILEGPADLLSWLKMLSQLKRKSKKKIIS